MEQWKGFVLIDNIKGSSKGGPVCGTANGSGFGAAVELGLQPMDQLIALGCFVNFPKKTNLSDELLDSCVTIASDASEIAVGGGRFIPIENRDFEYVCVFRSPHVENYIEKDIEC